MLVGGGGTVGDHYACGGRGYSRGSLCFCPGGIHDHGVFQRVSSVYYVCVLRGGGGGGC